jgi:hypothetical protein
LTLLLLQVILLASLFLILLLDDLLGSFDTHTSDEVVFEINFFQGGGVKGSDSPRVRNVLLTIILDSTGILGSWVGGEGATVPDIKGLSTKWVRILSLRSEGDTIGRILLLICHSIIPLWALII